MSAPTLGDAQVIQRTPPALAATIGSKLADEEPNPGIASTGSPAP